MLEKYQPHFAKLNSDEVAYLASRLPFAQGCTSGEELYNLCSRATVDQATVVMTLATDISLRACNIVETLIDRKITRPADLEQTTAKKPATRTRAPSNKRTDDPRVIVYVQPNPKRQGSAPAARYENYRVGMTVNEAVAAGLTPADIRWDEGHGFIRALLPTDPEAMEARTNVQQ